MNDTYIKVPPHEDRTYMNTNYYSQFTNISRFVQLYPESTHSKWGEIIDAWDAGIKIRITRVKNNLTCSGASYDVGSIHFIPMEKVRFSYVTEKEAKKRSCVSYKQGTNLTWDEFVAQAEGV